MSKLTDIIRREVEGCVAKQSGLIVTPATVTAVREDYLRADVKLLGNGAEIKGMLNKSAEKLTVGQTVTVAYSTLPSSGVILLANGEADLIREGGGVEVDSAVVFDEDNLHDWVADEELMLDISANTKLYYGGDQKLAVLQGYVCRSGVAALDNNDADNFGTKIELDSWYRESGGTYSLKHYVIELFVNEIRSSTSGGVTSYRYTFGFTVARYAQNSQTAEAVNTYTTVEVTNPSDAFLVLRVSSMSFATSFSTTWGNVTDSVSTPYGYVVCNYLEIQVGVLTADSPTAVTFPILFRGSTTVSHVYLNGTSQSAETYRCVPLSSDAEKCFDMGLTVRSEPVTGGGN